eukprot:803379-Prymnesium_polylepis.1
MGAVAALGRLPQHALVPHVARLIDCWDDAEWRVRRAATEVLAAISAPTFVPHAQKVRGRGAARAAASQHAPGPLGAPSSRALGPLQHTHTRARRSATLARP